MKGNIKMSEIARLLGVSVVTVSKALNGKEGVSKELREKIIQKTRELDYKLSASARAIRTNNNVGILISKKYLDKNSFYWNMFQDIQVKLLENNYFGILEICSAENEKKLILPRLISENKIEVLVVVGQLDRDYLKLLANNISGNIIFTDFYDTEIDSYCVNVDNYLCCYKITKYLIKKGHEDILYVGNIHATTSILDRAMGYYKCMLKYNKPIRDKWCISDRTTDGQYIMLELPSKMPTAFICNNDTIAHNLKNQLEQRGYRVPEDISIVGFDNYFMGESEKFITTIDVGIENYSGAIIGLLNKISEGADSVKERILLNGKIVENSSVRDLHAVRPPARN